MILALAGCDVIAGLTTAVLVPVPLKEIELVAPVERTNSTQPV